MLGQLGSNKLEVLLVEFALQVTVHLVVVEGAVFAQRANVLDPVGTAGVSDAQWKLPSQNPNAGGGGGTHLGGKRGGGWVCAQTLRFFPQVTEPEGTSGAQPAVQPPYIGFPSSGVCRKASPSFVNTTGSFTIKKSSSILEEVRLETNANGEEQLRTNVTPKHSRPNCSNLSRSEKLFFFDH